MTTLERSEAIHDAVTAYYGRVVVSGQSQNSLIHTIERHVKDAIEQEREDNDRILSDMQQESTAYQLGLGVGLRQGGDQMLEQIIEALVDQADLAGEQSRRLAKAEDRAGAAIAIKTIQTVAGDLQKVLDERKAKESR